MNKNIFTCQTTQLGCFRLFFPFLYILAFLWSSFYIKFSAGVLLILKNGVLLSDVLWGTFLVSIFVSSLFNCLIFTFTVMVNSLKISFSSMFPSAGSQFWVFRMHFVESSFNSWKLLKLFPRRFAQILTYFSENHKMKKYGILSTPCGYFMVFWANNLDISQYRE